MDTVMPLLGVSEESQLPEFTSPRTKPTAPFCPVDELNTQEPLSDWCSLPLNTSVDWPKVLLRYTTSIAARRFTSSITAITTFLCFPLFRKMAFACQGGSHLSSGIT